MCEKSSGGKYANGKSDYLCEIAGHGHDKGREQLELENCLLTPVSSI